MNNDAGSPLPIALIGCGTMGGRLARAVAQRSDSRLVWCVDRDIEAAERLAAEFEGPRADDDVEAVLHRSPGRGGADRHPAGLACAAGSRRGSRGQARHLWRRPWRRSFPRRCGRMRRCARRAWWPASTFRCARRPASDWFARRCRSRRRLCCRPPSIPWTACGRARPSTAGCSGRSAATRWTWPVI